MLCIFKQKVTSKKPKALLLITNYLLLQPEVALC